MKKLREPNETLVNFLKKIVLTLLVIAIVSWGLITYIIPQNIIPFLQVVFLKYQEKILFVAFLSIFLLVLCTTLDFLYFSKNSTLANVQMKYKLLSFSNSYIEEGAEVFFKIFDDSIRIEIFFNGTTSDEEVLGKKFSQWLKLPLIEYHEQHANIPAIYILGKTPERKDGIELLND